MSKMEFLGALEADKLTKQKWEQYCGTPCRIIKTEDYSPKVFRNLIEGVPLLW